MWTALQNAWLLAGSLIPSVPHPFGPNQQVPFEHPGNAPGRCHGPLATGGVWSKALRHAESLVSNMTLAEKV